MSLEYKAKRFVRAAARPPLERHHGWKEIFSADARAELTGGRSIVLYGQHEVVKDLNAARVQVAGYEARNVDAKGRIDGRTIRVDAKAAAYGGHATAAGVVTTGNVMRSKAPCVRPGARGASSSDSTPLATNAEYCPIE